MNSAVAEEDIIKQSRYDEYGDAIVIKLGWAWGPYHTIHRPHTIELNYNRIPPTSHISSQRSMWMEKSSPKDI